MGPETLSRSVVDGSARLDGGSTAEADRSDGADDASVLLDQRRDVLVIRPLDRLDAQAIERVGRMVVESSTAAIIDLNGCFLADPAALAAFGGTDLGGVEVCIVSGRLTCRRLLVRSGVTARFAVFQREEDALQARLLAADGYGRGWSTAVEGERRSIDVTNTVLGSNTSLTETAAGRLAATIELHGELCSPTAPQLHDEICRLIDDGVTHLVIDLTDLQLCTSHGLDVFDRAHQRLRGNGDGAVRLENARGVVDRVLSIVEGADPTFPALRQSAAD